MPIAGFALTESCQSAPDDVYRSEQELREEHRRNHRNQQRSSGRRER